MHIGIDLDNTIVDYSDAYGAIARKLGLGNLSSRKEVRDRFQKNDGSDYAWQEFQSFLYTQGLEFARPAPFLFEFLELVVSRGTKVSIVSHKTPTTQERFGGKDLRTPALNWLKTINIVPDLVKIHDLYFCDTLEEKISRIIELKLDLFIDDLDKVCDELQYRGFTHVWLYSEEHVQNKSGTFRNLLEDSKWIL